MEKLENQEVASIEEMITPDMAKAMDILAYGFLKSLGYDTTNCEEKGMKGKAARKRLREAIEAKGLELQIHMPTSDNKIFCYFTLNKKEDNAKVATSRSIEFVCQIVDMDKRGDKPSE